MKQHADLEPTSFHQFVFRTRSYQSFVTIMKTGRDWLSSKFAELTFPLVLEFWSVRRLF